VQLATRGFEDHRAHPELAAVFAEGPLYGVNLLTVMESRVSHFVPKRSPPNV